jgi:thioredoxin reductase
MIHFFWFVCGVVVGGTTMAILAAAGAADRYEESVLIHQADSESIYHSPETSLQSLPGFKDKYPHLTRALKDHYREYEVDLYGRRN